MAIQSGAGPQRREESLAGRLSADDAVGAMWNEPRPAVRYQPCLIAVLETVERFRLILACVFAAILL